MTVCPQNFFLNSFKLYSRSNSANRPQMKQGGSIPAATECHQPESVHMTVRFHVRMARDSASGQNTQTRAAR